MCNDFISILVTIRIKTKERGRKREESQGWKTCITTLSTIYSTYEDCVTVLLSLCQCT